MGRGSEVTITNEGATILKSLHIDNPNRYKFLTEVTFLTEHHRLKSEKIFTISFAIAPIKIDFVN